MSGNRKTVTDKTSTNRTVVQSSTSKSSSTSSSVKTSSTISIIQSKGIELLFKNPLQPAFVATRNAGFDFPDNFFVDRYRTVGSNIVSRFNDLVSSDFTKIPLRQIQEPDLSFTKVVDINGGFSLFNPIHQKAAGQLIKLLMRQPDVDAYISCCVFSKDRINPYMFQYALNVATAHRPDTRNEQIPSIIEIFPDQFVDPIAFKKAREEGALVEQGSRRSVEIPFNYTASNLEPEQRLAYFREDIGVNMHHWHWHLVYPGSGPPEIVNKDRRGELFYYMHNQIIARFNIERFSNQMAIARKFENLKEIIPEGYFPKIIRSSNNRAYPPRFARQVLLDVNRDDAKISVAELEGWRDRIYESIDRGYVTDRNGKRIVLDERQGIDVLGDIVEASDRSPNPSIYGSLHNQGHNIISFIHDPDNRHLEGFGVMGDVTTAMRDPIFYKWHSFIDSIFIRHKMKLPSYTDQQLGYNSILIQSINLQIMRNQNPPPQNVLLTYWQRSQVDLSAGLDFGPEGNIFATFTHLQHAPFTYRIMANNTSTKQVRGTCRIFMAPTKDERGQALKFNEQRSLMAEMDKFIVNLNPGSNSIVRRSGDSSVTIPFERTFRPVGQMAQPTEANAKNRFQFCGCGWPQHMLVPKGTVNGMDFVLFAMISNYMDDTIGEDFHENVNCNDAASFCGLRDRRYPDKRSMGYPFDRRSSANSINEFIGKKSNMAVQNVQIRFNNTIVNRA